MIDSLDSYTKRQFENELAAQVGYVVNQYVPLVGKRRAFLLGGQSGAGKTTLHHVLSNEIQPRPVIINGDEFRKSHPHFAELNAKYGKEAVDHTSKWSGAMTEALVDRLSALGFNLIVEGTLRTSSVPLSSAAFLRERGYAVSLALMAVKPEISLISCQIRYESMRLAGTTPRATDPKHHMKIVEAIVDNVKELEKSGMFDEIRLYTRSETCLFPADGEERSASEVLQDVLFGAWTDEEQKHYEHLQAHLEKLQGL